MRPKQVQIKHGMTSHPLYKTWKAMLYRCENPRHLSFANWGGRGITVCEAWHDIRCFVGDIEDEIGPRPECMTLDRIDPDKGYEPGNVRWATMSQQHANKRTASRKTSASGSRFKGVSWSEERQKWEAQIGIDRRHVHLGRFTDEVEAARAYNEAAFAAWGEFARLNDLAA